MSGHRRALAVSALILSAAAGGPGGVGTVTGVRYDHGRRGLRLPPRDHSAGRAAEYNRVVFDSGRPCAAMSCDVFGLPGGIHQAARRRTALEYLFIAG